MTDAQSWLLYRNTWKHLTVCKKNVHRLVQECNLQNEFAIHIYLIYMYEQDLALNNLPMLIWHKTQPNPSKSKKDLEYDSYYIQYFIINQKIIKWQSN